MGAGARSGSGRGFPAVELRLPQCRAVRDGSRPCRPRTQSSVAVSADYRRWFLLNASPDIRAQIESFPALHPPTESGILRCRPCCSPTASWITPSACCCCGRLVTSRYTPPTAVTRHSARGHTLLRTLERLLPASSGGRSSTGADVSLADGLSYRAFDVPTTSGRGSGPGRGKRRRGGLPLTDGRTGRALVYLPGVQELTAAVRDQLDGCTCLLFDGTFWQDDELIRLGIGAKTAREMGHLPIGGAGRQPASSWPRCRRAQDLHPHQQHQPDPARGRAERRTGRAARPGGRRGRAGAGAVSQMAVCATPTSFVGAPARPGAALPQPASVPREDERGTPEPRGRSRAGWPTASTTRRASRSRTPRSSPTAPTARSAGAGSGASTTTTARRDGEGGIEAWLRLGEAVGLTREEMRGRAARGARRALRRRRLRQLRPHPAVGRGGGLVAHRAVRARTSWPSAWRRSSATTPGSTRTGWPTSAPA